MINWLRKKLGIVEIEKRLDVQRKIIYRASQSVHRIDNYLGLQKRASKRSKRYDELERDQKRRRKAGTSIRYSKRDTGRQASNSGL